MSGRRFLLLARRWRSDIGGKRGGCLEERTEIAVGPDGQQVRRSAAGLRVNNQT